MRGNGEIAHNRSRFDPGQLGHHPRDLKERRPLMQDRVGAAPSGLTFDVRPSVHRQQDYASGWATLADVFGEFESLGAVTPRQP
jgi:hypothetical protein